MRSSMACHGRCTFTDYKYKSNSNCNSYYNSDSNSNYKYNSNCNSN